MRRRAYLLAAVLALGFAYDVTRIPVQVTDSLGDLLEVQVEPSMASAFASGLTIPGFLRPLKAVQTRLVSDLSMGSYTLAFRGVHVVLLLLTIWMFVRVMQVDTGTDLAAAAFALTVLLGLHTFANLLREAYPINHFLEIMLFALIALRLAQGKPGWLPDTAAALLLAVGALVVESGLLIWVVIVAAWLSGMRGISTRGLVLVTLLLCGYAYWRFVVIASGVPTLDERSSAVWLRVLNPEEINARFGGNPMQFFGYNIAAAVLSVLLSEPRAGLWVTVRAYLDSELWPWMVVALVCSTVTTALIITAAISSWRDRAGRDGSDRFYFIAVAVIAANAVLTYGYLKNDLMSLAGCFYALAAYAAVRRLLRRSSGMRPLTVAVLGVLLLTASAGWAVRTAGLHYSLRYAAFKNRNEWAAVPERWLDRPEWRPVTERLRTDALGRRGVAPRFFPTWQARWFEE